MARYVVSPWSVNVPSSCDDDLRRHWRVGVLARLCAASLDEQVVSYSESRRPALQQFVQ